MDGVSLSKFVSLASKVFIPSPRSDLSIPHGAVACFEEGRELFGWELIAAENTYFLTSDIIYRSTPSKRRKACHCWMSSIQKLADLKHLLQEEKRKACYSWIKFARILTD
jgi:hypothetical protein